MNRSKRILVLASAVFMISVQNSPADVSLPGIIGSNMVLQRNQDLKIWGWAAKGEKVTVHFNEAVQSTRAGKDGKWLITLPAMKAGGPYSMRIRGKNIIDLENVLIGDVWICSGQSNMEWPVRESAIRCLLLLLPGGRDEQRPEQFGSVAPTHPAATGTPVRVLSV